MPMPPDVMTRSDTVAPTKAKTRVLRLNVPATGVGVRDALARLSDMMFGLAVSADGRGNAEIVMAEMLNNIVEHAYRNRGSGRIDLVYEVNATRLRATVSDRGDPMPDHRPPAHLAAGVDVERPDLPEGGFGWFLIHELVDRLTYRRCGTKNIVRFTMRLC